MKCIYCRGLGYEPIEGGRKARCPDCRGTGQEEAQTNFPETETPAGDTAGATQKERNLTDMSTKTQPIADVKPAQITEAQVVAFMQAKQAELRKATGIHYAMMLCRVDAETGAPTWRSYCDSGNHLDAATADAAIAAQVAYLQPHSLAVRAKENRERADALLAEAEKLEKEAAK